MRVNVVAIINFLGIWCLLSLFTALVWVLLHRRTR